MNKQEFTEALAQRLDSSKAEGGRIVDAILDTIIETLGDREEVTLPGDVNADQASAEYHDGILTLTLPKTERAKVRTIKVGAHPQAIEGEKK